MSSMRGGNAAAARVRGAVRLERYDAARDDAARDDAAPELERLVRRQLALLGEDPEREGLLKTPERVAKALSWLTRGYAADVHDVIGDAIFEETHEHMVMVRDIEMY